MNGKLSEKGILYIERKEVFSPALCMDKNGGVCGDYCALFGEPETVEITKSEVLGRGVQEEIIEETALSLCRKTLQFANFEDQRISQK